MQKIKRLRVFAGPNGSGKSTLYQSIKSLYHVGYFVNADEIERLISTDKLIDLESFDLLASNNDLEQFSKTKEAKSLVKKSKEVGFEIKISIKENFILSEISLLNSYVASYIASFIRFLLYQSNKSFSFETVMSHSSKIEEIHNAKAKGYKTYLYFVCTDDTSINIKRVENRRDKGGHNVESEKIISRYNTVLQNLPKAISFTDSTYLFDNSGKKMVLIAEIIQKKLILKTTNPPEWFLKYVLTAFK